MKYFVSSLVLAVVIILAATSWAQNINPTFDLEVRAEVPEVLQLNYWIQEVEPDAEPYDDPGSIQLPEGTSLLDFGELQYNDEHGIFMADKYYAVFLAAATSGRPYQITHSCEGFLLDGAGPENLDKSLLLSISYERLDKFDPDEPDIQDDLDTSVETVYEGKLFAAPTDEHLVFESADDPANENSGRSRIIRCYYGIATGDPAADPPEPPDTEVVTTDFEPGEYSGTITLTVLLTGTP